MNLKRTVYHVAAKDYEANELIEFTFFIQRVSINNFLNLTFSESRPNLKVRTFVKMIGEFTIDFHNTNVDPAIRPIIVRCYPGTLLEILHKIGLKDWSELDTNYLYIRNTNLRALKSVQYTRYNGIHVFDPKTKRSWLTSNSPQKIQGSQAIINGKLWRKYYNN